MKDYSLDIGFDYNVSDQVITLIDTSVNATNITWMLPDGTFSSAANVVFELLEGENSFTLLAKNDCEEDSLSITILSTLTEDITGEQTSMLYPNPVSRFVNIASKTSIENVEIYNWKGQVLLSKQFEFPSKYEVFDLSILFPGIYVLVINNHSYHKLIVVK